ncbi:hypothetical protein BKA83DRAFT_4130606 [Pisolithus microcarpus]|nr:hypothetical protein BKA83DRAFT_4130606 [Pisolithus microcarpus]
MGEAHLAVTAKVAVLGGVLQAPGGVVAVVEGQGLTIILGLLLEHLSSRETAWGEQDAADSQGSCDLWPLQHFKSNFENAEFTTLLVIKCMDEVTIWQWSCCKYFAIFSPIFGHISEYMTSIANSALPDPQYFQLWHSQFFLMWSLFMKQLHNVHLQFRKVAVEVEPTWKKKLHQLQWKM